MMFGRVLNCERSIQRVSRSCDEILMQFSIAFSLIGETANAATINNCAVEINIFTISEGKLMNSLLTYYTIHEFSNVGRFK